MLRRLASIALLATLAGCATGPSQPYDPAARRLAPRGEPSSVIAAELAFARAAQEKGQWTAFAEYATEDAVMFVPQPVNARAWLKQQANPAQAVRWQPHQVWSSCDGTLAVTKGAWQRPNGAVGYFTTVWERQRDGQYKWVMDQGDTLVQPLAAPEMVGAVAASCEPQRPDAMPGVLLTEATDTIRQGRSRDGTLQWRVVTKLDGARSVAVSYWNGTAWEDALRERVAAQ